MVNRVGLVTVLVGLATGLPSVAQQDYWVEPGGTGRGGLSAGDAFGSLAEARDAIRARDDASITGDITVHLLPGTHVLTEPLVFDQRDSGRHGHRVIYQAHDSARPTVVSGGRRVTGPWQPGERGIQSTQVAPGIFTQLDVDGRRATPCQEPDDGWKQLKQWEDRYGSKSIRLQGSGNLDKSWQRQDQIEFVVKYHWAIMRLRFKYWDTYDGDDVLFPLDSDERIWNAIANRENNQRYRLENALEFVDEPGEWYLDRGSWRLYYLPRPGEDLATAVVVAPTLPNLITIRGSDAQHPVTGLEFRGLRFEHTNWLFKDGSAAYVGAQAWIQWNDWRGGPGAVELEYTDGIRLAGNVFRNLGGVGLKLIGGTHATVVEHNSFLDIGDTPILIFSRHQINPTEDGVDLSEPQRCRDDVVRDNVVARYGLWNLAAAGISLVIGDRCIIEHNEVSDGGYAGITIGYFTTHGSPSYNNVVRNNHVHHVMREVDDGAGIYIFNTHFDYHDKASRLYVERNFIHDVVRQPHTDWNPIGGIYLDEGAQAVVLRDNVVRDVGNPLHFNTGGGPERETLPERQTIEGNRDADPVVEAAAGPRGPRPPLAPPAVKPMPGFPEPKLLLHLPLTDPDSVGGATVHGAPAFADGAMAFDGRDDRLALPPVDPGNRYTVAMWLFIPDGTNLERVLIAGTGFRLVVDDGLNPNGDGRVERVQSWNELGGQGGGGQDLYRESSFPGSFPTDQWVHLAWTVDQWHGANRLYLNGRDVTRTDMRSGRPWARPFDTGLGELVLGADADGTRSFVGRMRDVRLYDAWLRPSEIAALAGE